MSSERNGDLGRPTADGDSGPYGSWLEIRRHAETSEPIPCPSLRPKRSNTGAAVRPSGLLAPRMLWPLDCFVARAPRNDGWVAADPIASVVIGPRLPRIGHRSRRSDSPALDRVVVIIGSDVAHLQQGFPARLDISR